jgi:hypothetical protein
MNSNTARARRDANAHATVADDDRVARVHVVAGDRARTGSVDDDRAVHLGARDVEPALADPHLGVEVGRRVERVGQHAVSRRRLEDRIRVFHHVGTGVAQFVEHRRQVGRIARLEPQPRV